MYDEKTLALEFWTIISFGLWWSDVVIPPITGEKSERIIWASWSAFVGYLFKQSGKEPLH